MRPHVAPNDAVTFQNPVGEVVRGVVVSFEAGGTFAKVKTPAGEERVPVIALSKAA